MSISIDELREALMVARAESEKAWHEAGRWIKGNSDDPDVVRHIDRCLVLHQNVKALERVIAQELAG